MPTLPNMGLITPTLGGDSGAWDDKINTAFEAVDAHDHTSGSGVPVPVAGIDIDTDLPMGGNGLTSLGKLSFSTITAPVSGSKNLFVNAADNELYWRTNGGANVKLTDGTSINTTLVGGIVGDYSTVGAEVAYDDANKRYTFKDETSPSKKWVRLASGPVRLFEHVSTASTYVELASPAALAASYTVTWPAALPGASAIMVMSSAGVVSLITLADTLYIPASAGATDGSFTYNPFGYWELGNNSGNVVAIPVAVSSGQQITGFTVYLKKNSDNTNTITAALTKISSTGSRSSVGSGTNAGNATGDGSIVVSSLTETVSGANVYQIEVTVSDGTPSSADRIYMTAITRTRVS